MGTTIISRRGRGSATIKFENYSNSPSKIASINLSEVKEDVVATATENYAFFAGGQTYSSGFIMKDSVDAYDKNLIKSTPSVLSVARHGATAAAIANYAIFAGGSASSYSSDTQAIVDAYDENLTRTTATELSHDRDQFSATTVGNYALFAGGQKRDESSYKDYFYDVVDLIDQNLVRSTLTALHTGNNSLSSAIVGNYALFAGGDYRNSDVVDVYSIAEGNLALTLYKGSKYKFQNMGGELTVDSNIENILIPYPVTGYVKIKNITIF